MGNKAHMIIHSAAVSAGGIGFSPIPFSDVALLTPLQVAMVTSLYKLYGKSIAEGALKGLIKTTLMATLGKSLVGNVIKIVPGVGWIAGGVINAGVAASLTEALGWTTVHFLENDEDLLSNAEAFTEAAKAAFKDAKAHSS
jgi:uncharacterized protein (DUF697 family)